MRRVIARREALNRINVFPVPDGDTGSNMAFTVGSVLGGALSRRASSAGELLRRVADDAIDGARGNSGAILAQFLQGAGESAGAARVLTVDGLARAVSAGSALARGALAEPREGTILSVIRAFAESLENQVASGMRDLRSVFEVALQRARAALADTPRQLPVLRQAGVVDAGAQGFVDLLEGIGDYLATGEEGSDEVEAETRSFAGHELHEDPDPEHRWCTECLIRGEGLDRDAIRAAIQAIDANSIVIAGSDERVRVHAHVAAPAALFEAASRFGAVRARKAEDMLAQHRSAMRADAVAMVTDSGADLPSDLCEALDIHMVPVRVNFGDEDFLDKVSISPAEFYARLRTSAHLPQTSQPAPGDFRRQFELLLAHQKGLVYAGISRPVSGTLQSGETAAARFGEGRARVVDTGHASCGQALLVMAAAEMARAGADADAVIAEVERLRPRTHTFAAARDLGFAVRGGRIPAWTLRPVQWLGLTPIARIRADGRLGVNGALFGRERVPERFARYILRRLPHGKRWRVLVGHCGCEDDGRALLDALRARLDGEGWLVEAGPAIGAHAGPQALVVGLQERD